MRHAIIFVIGVLGIGCGKGKQVGSEVCGVVGAKAKVCHDKFWARVGEDEKYAASYREQHEGKEEQWCVDNFKMGLAKGDIFDSCLKVDDCKAWSECVYPKAFFDGGK